VCSNTECEALHPRLWPAMRFAFREEVLRVELAAGSPGGGRFCPGRVRSRSWSRAKLICADESEAILLELQIDRSILKASASSPLLRTIGEFGVGRPDFGDGGQEGRHLAKKDHCSEPIFFVESKGTVVVARAWAVAPVDSIVCGMIFLRRSVAHPRFVGLFSNARSLWPITPHTARIHNRSPLVTR